MMGDVEPIDGELIYRGYSIKELVANVEKEDRFGFEEIAYLLLTGRLPCQVMRLKAFLRIWLKEENFLRDL